MFWIDGWLCVCVWVVETIRRCRCAAGSQPGMGEFASWEPLSSWPKLQFAGVPVCRRPSGVAPPGFDDTPHVRSQPKGWWDRQICRR
jgi:hypothetical protein